MAVRASTQLRYRPRSGVFRLPVRERCEAALADCLIPVCLRLIGLVDRTRAYVLGSEVEGVADLVLHCKTPLDEVRRMERAIRYGGDRNRRKAGIPVCQGRRAGELALREARVEKLIRRRSRIDGAARGLRAQSPFLPTVPSNPP